MTLLSAWQHETNLYENPEKQHIRKPRLSKPIPHFLHPPYRPISPYGALQMIVPALSDEICERSVRPAVREIKEAPR